MGMPTDQTPEEVEALKKASFVKNWLSELETAAKREEGFRKTGGAAQKLFEADDTTENSFNILFSNTETLAPALYNSVPRPVVRRRFKDEDPVGKAAAELCQRSLVYLLDSDVREYATFDDLMQSAVLSALVPGRGITRFKYDAVFTKVEAPENGDEGEVETAEAGESEEAEPYEKVSHEYTCGEVVPWDRFLHGYAKTWEEVPWIAIEHFMDDAELKKNFGEELAQAVEKVKVSAKTGSDEKDASEKGSVEMGHVYEIWDKATKKVYFISPGYHKDALRTVDDPLGLTGFFPLPKPLVLTRRVNSLLPVTPYVFYEEQAKELNRVTQRINKIVLALKVRGFYDSTVDGLDKVMKAGDNELIAAENVAALQQGTTLDKAIFLMPIEKLISVLQQLYAQRQQVKQVIYEITGIADIMRGASVASETLGAQQLKNQWGTLRLKRSQREVSRYARDCLRIMAEIAVTKFSPETLRAMTNMPLPLASEKLQAQELLQQAQAQMQAVPGGQPPQLPPQVQQSLAQAQKTVTSPTIDDLQKLLSDDLTRSYRIDIETNSTVDLEATEDKEDMAELMNALAQFLNGVAPAVEKQILPFDAAKSILLGLVRKFRFGADVEDQLKQMQAPPPPQPEGAKQSAGEPPEVAAAKAKGVMAAEEAKQATIRMNMEAAAAEHQFKMDELRRKAELALATHAAKMRQVATKSTGVTS